ncbi:DUF443 family protein [Enterococcus wangshanyuanii]
MVVINKVDTKYLRYKLIERNNRWYVVDVFSNFLIYVLPAFRWVIPFKAYRINLEQLSMMKSSSKKKVTNFWLVPMFATTIIVSRVLSNLMQDFVINSISKLESILFLVIITFGIIMFKLFKGSKEKNELNSIFKSEKQSIEVFEFKVRFNTVKKSYLILMISVQLIFYMLMLLFGYISLTYPSVFSYGLYALSLILDLFISTNTKLPNTISYDLKEVK